MPPRVNLPRLLSLLPKDGINSNIYQTRWAGKGFPVPSSSSSTPLDSSCHWTVNKVKLNLDAGKPTGRAWGVKYWKGKRVTPEGESELITGGLKYNWSAQQEPPLLVEEARLREEKRVEVAKSGEATEA